MADSTVTASEFARPEDTRHNSGPQDTARMLGGSGTRVITQTRPEGRRSSWAVPVVRDRLADLR